MQHKSLHANDMRYTIVSILVKIILPLQSPVRLPWTGGLPGMAFSSPVCLARICTAKHGMMVRRWPGLPAKPRDPHF